MALFGAELKRFSDDFLCVRIGTGFFVKIFDLFGYGIDLCDDFAFFIAVACTPRIDEVFLLFLIVEFVPDFPVSAHVVPP